MSQGDIVLVVPAKTENLPVRAGGDFIFLKEAARDVKVTIDGQTIIMRRGDKRRINRFGSEQAFETFEVSNPYDFDLRLVFVVGTGDYNSQIVTGELNVSSYVLTASLGVADSLPSNIIKRFGVESVGEIEHSVGDSLWVGPAGVTSVLSSPSFYGGKFWACDLGGAISRIVCFSHDSVAGEYDHVIELQGGFSVDRNNSPLNNGMVFDDKGNIYIRLETSLFVVPVGTNIIKRVADNVFGSPQGRGLAFHNGFLWACDEVLEGGFATVLRVNPVDGSSLRISLGDNGALGGAKILFVSGFMYVDAYYGSMGKVFNVYEVVGDSVKLLEKYDQDWSNEISNRGAECDPFFEYMAFLNGSGRFQVSRPRSIKHFGVVYFQDGDNDSSRVSVGLDFFPSFIKRSVDVVGGEFIGLFFKRVLGVTIPYRDYMTAVEYSDGVKRVRVDSGTQSWAMRGINRDYIELADGSDFVVTVLPDVFN